MRPKSVRCGLKGAIGPLDPQPIEAAAAEASYAGSERLYLA